MSGAVSLKQVINQLEKSGIKELDTTNNGPFLLTIKEAIVRYGISRKRLNRPINEGTVPIIHVSERIHKIPMQLADKAFEALATQGQEWIFRRQHVSCEAIAKREGCCV